MGFSVDVSVPAVTVFLQGLLSFFSPCVLPLLPLYIGYLSGGTASRGEDGKMYYKRSKVLGNTVCFVIGISFAFFLMGLGVSALGTFFQSYQMMFAKIGGILIVLFGFYQLGVFGTSKVLAQEHRLPFRADALAMSPVTALIMGFTFSFAWTPCVGPALTSVLLMATSAATRGTGFGLIGIYTLGFVLPFLAVGLFTTKLLEAFRKYRNVVQYTVKLGGVLMILMGFMMFTGVMNDVTGYLSGFSAPFSAGQDADEGKVPGTAGESSGAEEGSGTEDGSGREGTPGIAGEDSGIDKNQDQDADAGSEGVNSEGGGSQEAGSQDTDSQETKPSQGLPPAIGFELKDQYGNVHRLEDYKGKTIFLNFWATWCPPCRAEMPDIQKLYEERQTEGEDALVVLGVAAPLLGQEKSEEEIIGFLEENGYTYPVLMDTTGDLFYSYGIRAFPTTFMIDRDGNIFGYISGGLTEDMMHSIVRQTMEGKRD